MKPRVAPVCALAVLFLLLSPLLVGLAPPAAAATAPPPLREGVLFQCDDGASSKSTLLNAPGNATDCYLALDNHAVADDAWVDLSVQGTRTGARTNPFDRTPDTFPSTPFLDVSRDGDREWAFNSTRFGPVGHLTTFSDGTATRTVTLGANGSFVQAFDVPTNATILNATVTLSGDPVPYWAEQYQITNSSWSDDEEGPILMAFGDKLYAAWSTGDLSLVTGGRDLDVVIRSYNGTVWSSPLNLAPPPNQDSEDDREVNMIVYNGRLWVFWSHGVDNGADGVTDLYYRTFDGSSWSMSAWSAPSIVSRVGTDGLNTYENLEVFDGRLWVEWKTSDSNVSAGTPGEKDLDIVVRPYDGASDTWGPITELTAPANNTMDWISDMKAFDGKLYVVWEATNYDPYNPPLFSVDPSNLLMRVWNGTAWGSHQVPSNELDVREGNREDSAPRFSIYHNPVSGLDELYLLWMRGESRRFHPGEDYDIVYRVFNGAAWSPAQYLTESGDTDDDMFPCTVPYNGVLYSFWVSGVNTSIVGTSNGITLIATYGDIVYRAYNGREWSSIKEVTPLGALDNASHPSCTVYAGRLYGAWESPTNHANGTEWDVTVRNIDFNKVVLKGVYGNTTQNYTAPVGLGFSDTPYPFNLTALNSLLGNQVVDTDEFNNTLSRIPLSLSTENPATVRVTGIDVRYELRVRVNITAALNEQLAAEKGDLYSTSTVRIPLTVGIGGGGGRINLNEIHVAYRIDYPPTLIKSIASIKIDEDSGLAPPIDLNDYFTDDWDAGRLRFEMTNATNTQHVYFFLDGSQLSVGTLTQDWCGVATFKIWAFDRNAYFATSNDVTVFVRCVNDPPALQQVGDEELDPDQVFRGDLSAFDPDVGDVLTFASDSPWVDVDPATGSFLFGDKAGTPDTVTVNFTVTDLAGASDSKNATFHIVRLQQPPVGTTEYLRFDLPYWLLLLLLCPAIAYSVYRARSYRLRSQDEHREELELAKDRADLRELDEEGR